MSLCFGLFSSASMPCLILSSSCDSRMLAFTLHASDVSDLVNVSNLENGKQIC